MAAHAKKGIERWRSSIHLAQALVFDEPLWAAHTTHPVLCGINHHLPQMSLAQLKIHPKPPRATQATYRALWPGHQAKRAKDVRRHRDSAYISAISCRAPEITIDLKRRMRIKQIGIGPSLFPLLIQRSRTQLVLNKLVGPIPILQTRPKVHLPAHRPPGTLIASMLQACTCSSKKFRSAIGGYLVARMQAIQMRYMPMPVLRIIPVVHPLLQLAKTACFIGGSSARSCRRVSANSSSTSKTSAAFITLVKRSNNS